MRRTIIILSFLNSLTTSAQEGTYRYEDAVQLWRLTDNAAALGLDSTRNRGYASFNGEHHSGDYARVQEGTQTNQLRFLTERYQTVGRYLHAYGRFLFNEGRTKNRAWSDVMRPYDADPYFSGSDIRGKYDFQNFNCTAALGTTDLGGWRFGLRLDYEVGDLSRLRDPRPRLLLLDYRLTPAVTYTTGRHTLALSGGYERRKEKFTGVKNEQENATIKYYFLTGLEHADGKTNGYTSFWREWVDHRFAGELSYAYRSDHLHALLSLQVERGEEDIYEQYKYEPGHYVDYQYGVELRNRLTTGHILHQIDAGLAYEQSYADEYRQKLIQENDASTGLSSYYYIHQITYKKRYQFKAWDIHLHYRAHLTRNEEVSGYGGLLLSTQNSSQRHLLPDSEFSHGGTTVMAEGGLALGKRLWVDLAAGGFVARQTTLDLADPTTDYAQQVLLPDQPYYDANYWRAHLQLTYQFPLKIGGSNTLWFLRAYGDYLKTNNQLEGKTVGLSIGLFN